MARIQQQQQRNIDIAKLVYQPYRWSHRPSIPHGEKGLTSLAVIPSVTQGRAKMQKTVIPSLTRSTDSETDDHAMRVTVALRCGESVVKLTIHGGVSISHAPCLHCQLDLTDTISCSNRCMLMLYCLIAHLIVISRRPTMRDTVTGN